MNLSPQSIRLLAATADVDPRTLMRYLAGHAVRPSGAHRIRRAADDLGIALPSRASSGAS